MARAYGDAQTRRDDEEERDEDRGRSGKTQLFTDRGEDEVGFDPGHLVGATETESGARQTAFGHRERAFDDLEALALGVLPGVDPRFDARLHVIEPLIADVRAAREQQQSDQQVGRAFGGDPHHRDEHREEQQRRSEVSLHDEHDQRDAPRETDGAEVLRLGQVQRPELEAAHAQQFSVFDEVRREEDGERDLRDLTRLEAQAGETDPDAGAAHRATEAGRQGQQQQADADRHEDVAIAIEHSHAAQHEQGRDVRRHAEEGPVGLQAGQVFGAAHIVRDAHDEHVAQAVQQDGQRQQQRVGVGRQASGRDVRADEARRAPPRRTDRCSPARMHRCPCSPGHRPRP